MYVAYEKIYNLNMLKKSLFSNLLRIPGAFAISETQNSHCTAKFSRKLTVYDNGENFFLPNIKYYGKDCS